MGDTDEKVPPYEPEVGDIVTSRLTGCVWLVLEVGKTKYGDTELRDYETGQVVAGVRATRIDKNGRRATPSALRVMDLVPVDTTAIDAAIEEQRP